MFSPSLLSSREAPQRAALGLSPYARVCNPDVSVRPVQLLACVTPQHIRATPDRCSVPLCGRGPQPGRGLPSPSTLRAAMRPHLRAVEASVLQAPLVLPHVKQGQSFLYYQGSAKSCGTPRRGRSSLQGRGLRPVSASTVHSRPGIHRLSRPRFISAIPASRMLPVSRASVRCGPCVSSRSSQMYPLVSRAHHYD